LLTHDVNVSDFALNSEGTRAVSVDNDKSIYIWNVETGDCLFKKPVDIIDEKVDDVLALGYSGDLAIVVTDNFVRGYEDDGTVGYEYQLESEATFGDVDLNGKYVALSVSDFKDDTLQMDNCLILVDAATGEEYKRFPNHTEDSYGKTITYNESYDKLLVDHISSDDDKQNYATYIDINSGEVIDLPINGASYIGGGFANDGDVVLSSMGYHDLLSGEDCNMNVIKCNPLTGETKWTRELYYGGDILSSSYSYLRVREFNLSGTDVAQVLINGIQTLYALDLNTGEDVCSIKTTGYIENFMASLVNDIVCIATSDGQFYYYNGLTGSIYSNYTVDVSDSLIDFHYSNKVFVSKGYRNPSLTVMRFKEDEDYISKNEMESNVYGGSAVSPSGDSYMIQTAGDTDEVTICRVFDTKTGDAIGEYEVEDARYADSEYLDDDTIMTPAYNGTLHFYSIKKKKVEKVEIPEDIISMQFAISNNKRFVGLAHNSNFYVVDTKKREIVNSGEADIRFWSLTISNNGEVIYGITTGDEAYKVDTYSGSTKRIYKGKHVSTVVPSNDDNIIAVATKDGKLCVENLETGETENELDYFGDYQDYVKFSEDNNLLFLQGNDLYFKVYDRSKSKTVFLMDEQMNDLVNSFYDSESNTLSIGSDYDMFIIDLNTYGVLGYAERGRLFIPQYQTIVSVKGSTVTEFKVKTQEDLVEKVHERFGDAKLTEMQSLKYMVD
jgi:WD40 repeat protein